MITNKQKNEFWVYNNLNELIRIFETKKEAEKFIIKRKEAIKNSKPSSIFNKKAIRKLNNILK